MTVLIACERSGVIRDAFLRSGIPAVSCDIKPSRAPGPHLQCDVRTILHAKWSGLIAHPVCKYLTNSGVRWLWTETGRWEKMYAGVEFFNIFENAYHIPLRCVKNPVMHGYALECVGRTADQFVHPYHFGDPRQKATGLWLTGLPKLVTERDKFSYAPGEIKQEVWLMAPGPDREEKRSETSPELARAMVEQWGDIFRRAV